MPTVPGKPQLFAPVDMGWKRVESEHPFSCHWIRSPQVALKWLHADARSNTRQFAANVASPDYSAQQCVHVNSRVMIGCLVWIGHNEAVSLLYVMFDCVKDFVSETAEWGFCWRNRLAGSLMQHAWNSSVVYCLYVSGWALITVTEFL